MAELNTEIIVPPMSVDTKKLDEIGYFLQDNNTKPNEEQEKITSQLCIKASDIADVYLLSHIDEPSGADDPKTTNMSTLDEIKYHTGKLDDDRSVLFADTADYSRSLAMKHVLAATRAMLYEYKRWTSKDTGYEELIPSFTKMINMAEKGQGVSAIMQEVDIANTLNILKTQFKNHHNEWSAVCEATTNLYQEIAKTQDSLSHRGLLVNMTFLHQATHAGGGGVLELMLEPGQKQLGNELLLRFNSEDTRLTNISMFEFGSIKAKKLFQKDRRQREPFTLLNPEVISEEETQILLSESLLKDSALSQRIDRASKSLQHYPLFGTVLFNIFGGDLNPQDEQMDMARHYLQSSIDTKSVNPSIILDHYLKDGGEKSLDVFYIAQNPNFLSSLSSETQNNILQRVITTLSKENSDDRIKALMFIEISGVLNNNGYGQNLRNELLTTIGESQVKAEPDSKEYYLYERLLVEK